jgi:hypothetical protein
MHSRARTAEKGKPSCIASQWQDCKRQASLVSDDVARRVDLTSLASFRQEFRNDPTKQPVAYGLP